MAAEPYDLVVRAGRVVSPGDGLDEPGAVAIVGDRIAAVATGEDAAGLESTPASNLDFPDGLLLPGLIDLHAHPAVEGSRFGIDPDLHMLPRGTTTVLSQGDAGARNWAAYRDWMIDGTQTRVRLAINLAAAGESKPDVGCFEDLAEADVDACVAAIRSGPSEIWGIAVNAGAVVCGDNDPREILARGLRAAEQTGKPILYGARRQPDWSWDEQLDLLRPGDIVTYCFSGLGDTILEAGRVRRCVWDAHELGILFDLGHGAESFDFEVAQAAIGEGFLPDSISTDKYRRHVGAQPVHDLPLTVSKLLAAGLAEPDAWPRIISRPAGYLGLHDEIGRLTPGACADLAVLRWNGEPQDLQDTMGNRRRGGRWEPLLTVRAGRVVAREPKVHEPDSR